MNLPSPVDYVNLLNIMKREMLGSFEIIVRKDNDTFKATCSVFPGICGEGTNEQKAIENLADGLAHKMGGLVKTVLREVFNMPPPRTQKSRPVPQMKEPFWAELQPIDCLFCDKNIDYTKRRPALHGKVMMLDMRPEKFCRPMPDEEYIYAAVRQSGIFNTPIPTECETPYGILLGVPLTYN